jgi:hypothetical protein
MQRTHPQVQQLVTLHAQGAADEERNDARVERVRRGAVTPAGHDADADLVRAEHLVEHGLRQRGRGAAGLLGLCAHGVGRLAPGLGGFGMLALAALRSFALGAELRAALQLDLFLGAGLRRQRGGGGGGGSSSAVGGNSLFSGAQRTRASPRPIRVLICSDDEMRKLESGNGCDNQPPSRWMYMPTRNSSTAMVLDITLPCQLMGHPDGGARLACFRASGGQT